MIRMLRIHPPQPRSLERKVCGCTDGEESSRMRGGSTSLKAQAWRTVIGCAGAVMRETRDLGIKWTLWC